MKFTMAQRNEVRDSCTCSLDCKFQAEKDVPAQPSLNNMPSHPYMSLPFYFVLTFRVLIMIQPLYLSL